MVSIGLERIVRLPIEALARPSPGGERQRSCPELGALSHCCRLTAFVEMPAIRWPRAESVFAAAELTGTFSSEICGLLAESRACRSPAEAFSAARSWSAEVDMADVAIQDGLLGSSGRQWLFSQFRFPDLYCEGCWVLPIWMKVVPTLDES